MLLTNNKKIIFFTCKKNEKTIISNHFFEHLNLILLKFNKNHENRSNIFIVKIHINQFSITHYYFLLEIG